MNCYFCGKLIEMVNDANAVLLSNPNQTDNNMSYAVTIKACEHIYDSAVLTVVYK